MQSRQKLNRDNTTVSGQNTHNENRHYNEHSNGEGNCRQVPKLTNIASPLFASSTP